MNQIFTSSAENAWKAEKPFIYTTAEESPNRSHLKLHVWSGHASAWPWVWWETHWHWQQFPTLRCTAGFYYATTSLCFDVEAIKLNFQHCVSQRVQISDSSWKSTGKRALSSFWTWQHWSWCFALCACQLTFSFLQKLSGLITLRFANSLGLSHYLMHTPTGCLLAWLLSPDVWGLWTNNYGRGSVHRAKTLPSFAFCHGFGLFW